MLEVLATIGTALGIGEASRLLDDASLDPGEAEIIANRIIDEASKRGTAILTKARQAIEDIPYLSSSPSVKAHLTKARSNAYNNYAKVEQQVADMNKASNEAANKIRSESSHGFLTKVKDLFKTGKTSGRRARIIAKNAIDQMPSLDRVENGVENPKIITKLGEENEKKI